MTNVLTHIVELQGALDELAKAERQLAGVPDWMEELHSRYSARLNEIRDFEAQAEEASASRRKAEGANEDAGSRLKHFQEQVSMVRTQREYSALLQEIDVVKAEIKGLEDEALQAMEAFDSAQVELERQRADFEALDSEYSEALGRWEKQKPAVADKVGTLERQIEGIKGGMPRNVLSLFERIYERNDGDATALVRQTGVSSGDRLWHCTACNYRVRLHMVTEMRRGTLCQCDGCRRILFVEVDTE